MNHHNSWMLDKLISELMFTPMTNQCLKTLRSDLQQIRASNYDNTKRRNLMRFKKKALNAIELINQCWGHIVAKSENEMEDDTHDIGKETIIGLSTKFKELAKAICDATENLTKLNALLNAQRKNLGPPSTNSFSFLPYQPYYDFSLPRNLSQAASATTVNIPARKKELEETTEKCYEILDCAELLLALDDLLDQAKKRAKELQLLTWKPQMEMEKRSSNHSSSFSTM